MKKLLSSVLSFIIIIMSFPTAVFAQNTPKFTLADSEKMEELLRRKMEEQMVQPVTRPIARPVIVPLTPVQERAIILKNSVTALFMPVFGSVSQQTLEEKPFTYSEFKNEIKKLAAQKNINSSYLKESAIKDKYNLYLRAVKEEQTRVEDTVLTYLKKDMRELMSLYRRYPSQAAIYLAQCAPLVWGYENILTQQDKKDILALYRKALSEPKTCDKECALQINALSGLGQSGDIYDGKAIYEFIYANLTNKNTPQILLSGVSALLLLGKYDLIDSLLNNATVAENLLKSSDIDMLSVSFYVSALGVVRGQYYGKISAWGKYNAGNNVEGNAWTDIAAMLAQEGSAQSRILLKKYGVDKCRVMREIKIDGSYGYKVISSAIQPFLAGALISGASGADSYDPEHLTPVKEIVFPTGGNGYIPSQKDIDYSVSLSNGYKANLNTFAKQEGLGKGAVFAANMMNAGMGDISAEEEYTLDKALYSKYPELKKIKGKYAVVDSSSLSDKQSRQSRLQTAKKVGFAADVAILALAAYGAGKIAVSAARGFGSLGREVYQGMRLARLGNSAAISAEVSKNMSAYKFIVKNRMTRQNAISALAKNMQSFTARDANFAAATAMYKEGRLLTIKPPVINKPVAKPQTLQFEYSLLKEGEVPAISNAKSYTAVVGSGSGASSASAKTGKQALSRVASAWRKQQQINKAKQITKEAEELLRPFNSLEQQRANLYARRSALDKKLFGDKFYSELSPAKQWILDKQANFTYSANIAKSILKYGAANPKTYAGLVLPTATTMQTGVAQVITVNALPSSAFITEAASSANTLGSVAKTLPAARAISAPLSSAGFGDIASLPLIAGIRPQDRFTNAKGLNAAEKTMTTAQYIANALNPFNAISFNAQNVRLSAADINLAVSNDKTEQHFKTVVNNILNALQQEQAQSSVAAMALLPLPKIVTDRLTGQKSHMTKSEADKAKTALNFAYISASEEYAKQGQDAAKKLKDGSAIKDPVFTDMLLAAATKNLKAIKKLDLAGRNKIIGILSSVLAVSDDKVMRYEGEIAQYRNEFETLRQQSGSSQTTAALSALFKKVNTLNASIFKDADNTSIRQKLTDNPQLLMFSILAQMQESQSVEDAVAADNKKSAEAKATAFALSENQNLIKGNNDVATGAVGQSVRAVNEYINTLNQFKTRLDEASLIADDAAKKSAAAGIHKEIMAFDKKVTGGANRNALSELYFNKTKGLIRDAYMLSKGLSAQDIAALNPVKETPKTPVLTEAKAQIPAAQKDNFTMLDKIILKQKAEAKKKTSSSPEDKLDRELDAVYARLAQLDINEDYIDILAAKYDFAQLDQLYSELESIQESVFALIKDIALYNNLTLEEKSEEVSAKIEEYLAMVSSAEGSATGKLNRRRAASGSGQRISPVNMPDTYLSPEDEQTLARTSINSPFASEARMYELYDFLKQNVRLPDPNIKAEHTLYMIYNKLPENITVADNIRSFVYNNIDVGVYGGKIAEFKKLILSPSRISYSQLSSKYPKVLEKVEYLVKWGGYDISLQEHEQLSFLYYNWLGQYEQSGVADFTPAVENMRDARNWLMFALANKEDILALKDELAKGMILRDINRKALKIINLNNEVSQEEKLSPSAFESVMALEDISEEYSIPQRVAAQPLLPRSSTADLINQSYIFNTVGYASYNFAEKVQRFIRNNAKNNSTVSDGQFALLKKMNNENPSLADLATELKAFIEKHGFWPREDSYNLTESKLSKNIAALKYTYDKNYRKIDELRKEYKPKEEAKPFVMPKPVIEPKPVVEPQPAPQEQQAAVNQELNKEAESNNVFKNVFSKIKKFFGKK